MGLSAQDIRTHLHKGEQVVWFGRPSQPVATPQQNLKNTIILLLMIAGSIGARFFLPEVAVLRIVTLLFILALCGILFAILVVEPFAEKKRMRRTVYAITPERAIVIYGAQVFSQALNADTRYRLSDTSPAILEIWSHAGQARAEVPPMRFQNLADGGRAKAALDQLLGGNAP